MARRLVTDMTYAEFEEWATGHILTELIAGRLHLGVSLVLNQLLMHREAILANSKRERGEPS